MTTSGGPVRAHSAAKCVDGLSPLFTPESVLAAAFGKHDFIGHIGDHEITIRTSAPL
jgi:hypothetical protein